MNVRVAQPADAGDIASIHVETWRIAYNGQISEVILKAQNVEFRMKFWRERLVQSSGSVFVSEDDSVVFGFCDLAPSRDKDADARLVAEIVAIYVLPAYWRKGAGHLLCRSALVEARRQNYQSVTLWVLASNIQAQKFYTSMGFQPDGTSKTEKMMDGTELHEIRFCINLH